MMMRVKIALVTHKTNATSHNYSGSNACARRPGHLAARAYIDNSFGVRESGQGTRLLTWLVGSKSVLDKTVTIILY